MKSINIKGKEYIPVNERIKEFRGNEAYKGLRLISTIEHLTDDMCVIRAEIKNETGETIATGYAHEERTASNINRTSFVENCETSAWGRALANLGIGIDASVASADELKNAIDQQEAEKAPIPQTYISTINGLIDEVGEVKGKDAGAVMERLHEVWQFSELKDLSAGQGLDMIKTLRKWAGKKG